MRSQPIEWNSSNYYGGTLIIINVTINVELNKKRDMPLLVMFGCIVSNFSVLVASHIVHNFFFDEVLQCFRNIKTNLLKIWW
jgi:hypothetical protein